MLGALTRRLLFVVTKDTVIKIAAIAGSGIAINKLSDLFDSTAPVVIFGSLLTLLALVFYESYSTKERTLKNPNPGSARNFRPNQILPSIALIGRRHFGNLDAAAFPRPQIYRASQFHCVQRRTILSRIRARRR